MVIRRLHVWAGMHNQRFKRWECYTLTFQQVLISFSVCQICLADIFIFCKINHTYFIELLIAYMDYHNLPRLSLGGVEIVPDAFPEHFPGSLGHL